MRNMWSRGIESPARCVTFSIAETSSGFVLSSGSYLLKIGSMIHVLMKTTNTTIGNAQSQKSAHQRRGLRRISHKRIEPNSNAAPMKSDTSLVQSSSQEPHRWTDCSYRNER